MARRQQTGLPQPDTPVPTGNPADQFDTGTPSGPLGSTSAEQKAPPLRDREGYARGYTPSGSVNFMEHAAGAQIPFYYAGDEYKIMNRPAQIPRTQMLLVAAGFLDEKDVRFGVWDEKSATAYREAMSEANHHKVNVDTLLQGYAANPSQKMIDEAGGGGAGGQEPVITLTNPAELRESFREAFNGRVGYDPPQSAMDAFVNSYHGIEASKGKALNEAAPGSTFVQGPSPETYADEEIRRKYEAEQHAYSAITRQQEFFASLGPIA